MNEPQRKAAEVQLGVLKLQHKLLESRLKGDKPGHPFRGNQWSGEGGGEGSSSDGGLGDLQKELGSGAAVHSTVGGLTSVQSTTGYSLTPKQLKVCISKMSKGDSVHVVLTNMVGRGDEARGMNFSGKLERFGKMKDSGDRVAVVKVEKGDFPAGTERVVSPITSIHNLTWG